MAPLRLAVACLAAAVGSSCQAETVADWRSYTAEASLRFGVPTEWIERVMRAESNGQTMLNGHLIRSRVGAIGLMQLMPATWEMLRRLASLGPNPDNPRDNILAGALYLRMMYDRFGYPGMFAAYDAGSARYSAHLATGRALPNETIAYLQKVGGTASSPRRHSPPVRLFAVRYQGSRKPSQSPFEPKRAALFAIQNDAL